MKTPHPQSPIPTTSVIPYLSVGCVDHQALTVVTAHSTGTGTGLGGEDGSPGSPSSSSAPSLVTCESCIMVMGRAVTMARKGDGAARAAVLSEFEALVAVVLGNFYK